MEASRTRQRKKSRTRQTLVDSAVRLFRERGYEQTTVAQIAAAADVTERTFFLHFPSKEAVLFAQGDLRVALGVAAIARRAPGEAITAVLARAVDDMVADLRDNDLRSGLAALRVQLATTVPALESALLQRMLRSQDQLSAALVAACPDELDRLDAVILVGSLLGAVNAAITAAIRDDGSAEAVARAVARAKDVALRPTIDAARRRR